MSDTDLITASDAFPETEAKSNSPAPVTSDVPVSSANTAAESGGNSLATMVLPELRALATRSGVKGTSGMRKGELIAAIRESQNGGAVPPRPAPARRRRPNVNPTAPSKTSGASRRSGRRDCRQRTRTGTPQPRTPQSKTSQPKTPHRPSGRRANAAAHRVMPARRVAQPLTHPSKVSSLSRIVASGRTAASGKVASRIAATSRIAASSRIVAISRTAADAAGSRRPAGPRRPAGSRRPAGQPAEPQREPQCTTTTRTTTTRTTTTRTTTTRTTTTMTRTAVAVGAVAGSVTVVVVAIVPAKAAVAAAELTARPNCATTMSSSR